MIHSNHPSVSLLLDSSPHRGAITSLNDNLAVILGVTYFLQIIPANLQKRLDKSSCILYNQSCFGRLAQLVEHALDVRRVSGSSPLSSTKKETTPKGVVFLFGMAFQITDSKGGSWQVSGGHLPPPWLFHRKASP